MFERGVVDIEVHGVLCCVGVEDGVSGFGRVGDEIIAVEVSDEVAELRLC